MSVRTERNLPCYHGEEFELPTETALQRRCRPRLKGRRNRSIAHVYFILVPKFAEHDHRPEDFLRVYDRGNRARIVHYPYHARYFPSKYPKVCQHSKHCQNREVSNAPGAMNVRISSGRRSPDLMGMGWGAPFQRVSLDLARVNEISRKPYTLPEKVRRTPFSRKTPRGANVVMLSRREKLVMHHKRDPR